MRRISELEADLAERDKRIAELERRLEPCDTCGSIDCEDSDIAYYIKRWKESEASLAEQDNCIEELEELVQKMKRCDNCEHNRRQDEENSPCVGCDYYSEWSIKK